MTKGEALKWVNLQMAANVIEDTEMDGVSRCSGHPKEIQIYKGLPKLAHALELPYNVSLKENGEYPIRLTFKYDGYTFVQIEKSLADATGKGEEK